jgi:hypothetical protein
MTAPLPDRHGPSLPSDLCVMGRCTRRRARAVPVRIGGRSQSVEVCELHARRLAG